MSLSCLHKVTQICLPPLTVHHYCLPGQLLVILKLLLTPTLFRPILHLCGLCDLPKIKISSCYFLFETLKCCSICLFLMLLQGKLLTLTHLVHEDFFLLTWPDSPPLSFLASPPCTAPASPLRGLLPKVLSLLNKLFLSFPFLLPNSRLSPDGAR